jgi:hypothetical protein
LSDRLPETTKGRAHHKDLYPSAARPSLSCFCRLKTRRFPPHSCEKVGFVWKADTRVVSRYRAERFCQGSRYNFAGRSQVIKSRIGDTSQFLSLIPVSRFSYFPSSSITVSNPEATLVRAA